jgi:hypothetical protein
MLRRIVSLVCASSLTVAGAAGLIYLLFFAVGWKGWMLMAAGLVCVAGIVWLYDDFINGTPNQN